MSDAANWIDGNVCEACGREKRSGYWFCAACTHIVFGQTSYEEDIQTLRELLHPEDYREGEVKS